MAIKNYFNEIGQLTKEEFNEELQHITEHISVMEKVLSEMYEDPNHHKGLLEIRENDLKKHQQILRQMKTFIN